MDDGWNRGWAAVRESDEDPIRLAAGQQRAIAFPMEGIFAGGADPADVMDPCGGVDPVIQKGGPKVFNVMRARDPGGLVLLVDGLTPHSPPMLDGERLHPLYIDDIIDVAIGVDGRRFHDDFHMKRAHSIGRSRHIAFVKHAKVAVAILESV